MRTSVAFIAMALVAAGAQADEALLKRGEYLAHIMDCGGCHTTGSLTGQPQTDKYLAGSDIGFGGPPPQPGVTGPVVYPPNLTSDVETGLGAWTDEQIIAAVRLGQRPDGRQLAPVMPWPAYSHLSDDDAKALAAFLKSLPPVVHQVPAPVPPGGTITAPYLTMAMP